MERLNRKRIGLLLAKKLAAACLVISATSQVQAEWQTVCQNNRCELTQKLFMPDRKTVISQIVFSRYEANGAAQDTGDKPAGYLALIYLPLGLHIAAGVTASIDTTRKIRAQLLDCDAKVGCRAAFIPTVKTVQELSAGTTLNVTIMDAKSRQLIHFPYPLTGLAAQLQMFHGGTQ